MRSYFEQTLLWAIALLIGLSGCSSAPALVFQSRTVQPGKQAEPAYSLSGRRHYSTWSYGAASAEDALELAYVGVVHKAFELIPRDCFATGQIDIFSGSSCDI